MITYILIGIIAILSAVYLGTHSLKRKLKRRVFIKLVDSDDNVFAVLNCYSKKCEGCVLSFRCGTQREAIELSWDQWLELKSKLKRLR
jgi:hypothetical protein